MTGTTYRRGVSMRILFIARRCGWLMVVVDGCCCWLSAVVVVVVVVDGCC